ncbi:HK97 family phage portal protein [Novosphingobium sp. PhB165]|uniref:phage portal protein n=1 Tax=Novosphingobium sp. PhB165 TaxID=2485105 RepID=UPI001046C069|nr:phage portal protein [Novosphingobium sp. PhB165]TCM17215.1 HK97 family phage portal protein [Novosphingobium sp. PhB165]
MRLFGFEISRAGRALSSPSSGGGWTRILEPFVGAWQKNVEVNPAAVLAFHAVFSCMTLIASDIAKLRVKLVELSEGVWTETTNPSYSPVLRKPNGFQTRNQFWENWFLSKLSKGNTYVLKDRDGRGVVTALYILDPDRVEPLVSEDGGVYYRLQTDYLSGITEEAITVPANEIIHDRFNCLFHPLVGLSPIYASGLAATQGLQIQNTSARFFGNGSKPGGLLVAPGKIDQANADRLKEYWNKNFTGENAGKIAVLGDGLKYEALTVNAKDAELIQQLKWTAEVVCSTFHVPPYKIGVGTLPSYNNVQALNVEYFSQCLQSLIEAAETCMDEGLKTGEKLGTEFDTENLLRMDSVTQMQVLKEGAGILKVDEMRAKLDKKPTEGGDAVYLQQQNYSLAALAKRDAQDDPFGKSPPTADTAPANDNSEAQRAASKALLEKRVRERLNA